MNPCCSNIGNTNGILLISKHKGNSYIYKDYIMKITATNFKWVIPWGAAKNPYFVKRMSNETLPRLFWNIELGILKRQRGIKQVDVIIGGPLHAYSLVEGQSKHMETPMSKRDPRNDSSMLYARSSRNIIQKMFVLECYGNRQQNSGATWLKVQEALRLLAAQRLNALSKNSKAIWKKQKPKKNGSHGGGWRIPGFLIRSLEQTIADATVNDISDLPALQPEGNRGIQTDDFSDYLRSTGIRKDSEPWRIIAQDPSKTGTLRWVKYNWTLEW